MDTGAILQVRQKLPLPETVDWYFLLLRLLTVAGGLVWYLLVPHDPGQRVVLAWLLGLYTLYSCLLYAGIFRWPQAIRSFYLATFGVDLIFVAVLVQSLTGTVSFFIAFYLLVAIHSYYFGLQIALFMSVISALLYSLVYFNLPGFSSSTWPDFVLRIMFLFLIALSLGLLAQRDKQRRRKVEELNRELAYKNSILEQTFQHLSIGKLIGEIAENVNGPCGIMSLRSEVLMQDARRRGLSEEFIKGLGVINKCSHQVGQLIKALSSFSKQEGFQMAVVDFNELIEETLILMDNGLQDRSIRIDKDLEMTLPMVRGDAYELKGVLINLISNAMDALPRGGTIRIATHVGGRNGGGEVICKIADDGVGIPEKNLGKIFNPFFTTKDNRGGIGLGLSTSLSVMKSHDGLITVESAPGSGSEFSLSLPISKS